MRDERGSATIEAVLWLPIFFALFALMTDVAMIFNGHSRITRVIQDANRNLSVGRFTTEAKTEAYIVTALAGLSSHVGVQTTITAGVATTSVSVPARDLQMLGLFSALTSIDLRFTSQQFIEY